MTKLFVLCVSLLLCLPISAQYDIKVEKKISCTPVKNQEKSGTCWSYSTASFLESEILKNSGQKLDLSEMFIVRNNYRQKALNYYLRQGKANFSEGSLSHDVINMVAQYGIVPESLYSGKANDEKIHNHTELVSTLKAYLDATLSLKNKTAFWRKGVVALLDVYLGQIPDYVRVEDMMMDPIQYAQELGINKENYMSFSSFNHHPFYEEFILEIPDNYSNGSYYNVPIEKLVAIVDFALINGHTIAWDGDVSEPGFSSREGLAVLPVDAKREDLFKKPAQEMEVTQENRQEAFETQVTTDDHLMHIVGYGFDQNGTKYYLVKNSWGIRGPYDGYLYMSEAYFKMKTTGILLNKDALPQDFKN